MRVEGCFPVIHPMYKDWLFTWFKPKKIMTSIAYLADDEKTKSIHKIMDFRGEIFLDCGSFHLFTKKLFWNDVFEYRKRLERWYEKLKPDLASGFDIPSLLWHRKDIKRERLMWSIGNYDYLQRHFNNSIPLVLGVCAFSEKSVKIVYYWVTKKLNEIPPLIGLGGQVPLMIRAGRNPDLGKIIVRTLYYLRKYFASSSLHVYGAGGHRWYMLVRLLGANSADYAGYTFHTGRGRILLPGVKPRYILRKIQLKTRTGYRYYIRPHQKLLNIKELQELGKCACPVCTKLDSTFLEFNKAYRLIHNFHVFLSEANIVDEFCETNNMEGLKKHVKTRLILSNSGLKEVAEYALQLIRK